MRYRTVHGKKKKATVLAETMYSVGKRRKKNTKHQNPKLLLFLLHGRERVLLKSRVGDLQAQESLYADKQDNKAEEEGHEAHEQAWSWLAGGYFWLLRTDETNQG